MMSKSAQARFEPSLPTWKKSVTTTTSCTHACYPILTSYPNFLYILVIKDATFTSFWYKNAYFLNGTGITVSHLKLVQRTLQKCIQSSIQFLNAIHISIFVVSKTRSRLPYMR